MSYKIEALPPFAKEVKYLAKRYKSLKEDILRLRDELLENPLSGTEFWEVASVRSGCPSTRNHRAREGELG